VPLQRFAVLAAFAIAASAQAAETIDFQRDIRPVLSDKCFACHGPDDKTRLAGLRLDTPEGAARVLVPGDPAASRLFQRITAEKRAARMPPPGAGDLTDTETAALRRWIEQGAKWATHWAYVPPQWPEPPLVKQTAWPRNPIDRFLLARLEREGLTPAPPADKTTLLRRATLDLTGLPPTPAEIDSFLADKSPGAYEKRVDQLLASPRYGERMAAQWLDLARYADTHGYHIDSHRDMWPWRDWVIAAFNRNLPYDRFTIEQLAGDLLPDATRDQKIATGFNRNHMINFEGGAIPEEYQNEYVVDRVEVTSTVWLGTTMGCARCHDHKYDPIKQKEFYQFAAFFNTVPEKGLDGRAGNAEPYLPLPDPVQERQLDEIGTALKAREDRLESPQVAGMQEDWEKSAALPEAPREGLLAHYEFDGSLADSSGFYRRGRLLKGDVIYNEGRVGRAGEFGADTRIEFAHPKEARALAFWMRYSGAKSMRVIESDALTVALDDAEKAPELKRAAYLYIGTPSGRFRSREKIIQRDWYHIAVNFEPPAVSLNGQTAEMVPADQLPEAAITYRGQLDDVRWYGRPLSPEEIRNLAIEQPVRALLWDSGAKRSKDQQQRLRDYFLTFAAPESYRTAYAELKVLEAQKKDLEKTIPTVMVMSEMEKPRDTHVLGRGDYRNKGEKVMPGVPAMFPPLPKGAAANRLTLARWLVDPAHPLTARVAVNRFWQMYFGTGIVKTAEDFGSQGEAPVHAELLDWLATEFIRTGWDVKAMQRLIVTSAAYRQSSKVSRELLEKDPENRLLARGPRSRLPAETLRDNALAAAGLLVEKIGGPSVMPYSPKGLWEDIAYGDVFSAQTYEQGHGSKLYRRSLYTFWKRTAPPATLATFDAPDREKCTARRPLTNTPLQALALMNDPAFVEAARALAERALLEEKSDKRRIVFAFRQATGRAPAAKEAAALRQLAKAQAAHYRKDPESARALLAVGESKPDESLNKIELAAWTTVASAILSLDETITKE
jgi:hypothetical protein